MISGVHHIAMKCGTEEEIERVRNFYIDTLGMKVRREWPDGIMLDAGNCLLEVFTNGDGVKELGALRHIAFATDDVDAIIQQVKMAGYEVFVEPTDKEMQSSPVYPFRMAFCYGPLGEEVEFFCEK